MGEVINSHTLKTRVYPNAIKCPHAGPVLNSADDGPTQESIHDSFPDGTCVPHVMLVLDALDIQHIKEA
jgi:hypothetical protein